MSLRIAIACFALLLCAIGGRSAKAAEKAEILEQAHSESNWMLEIRKRLHAQPELAYEEYETSELIRDTLKKLGIPFQHPYAGKTGIVATIGKGSPRIALRTDIDALPILEEVDVPWKSKAEGKMHACGHDAHMTMLLGAAKLLKAREQRLPGTVVLLFQPAEEGGAGGKKLVEEGALEGVAAVHGIHVWPPLPTGIIGTRVGTIMAAADRFSVTVHGRGGHAAMPHLARDPVVAASAIVGALQHLVSRETSPTGSAVVTVAVFNTGAGAFNVIPDKVQLGGTVRALTREQFDKLRERVREVIEGTASAHGCRAELSWSAQAYGPTVNAKDMVDVVLRAGQSLIDAERVQALEEPTMAAEDFSFLADAVPGAFTFLGINNESAGSVHGLHTPRFRMDDSQLPLGAALHTAVALTFFEDHKASQSDHAEL
ncbi:hypothetical protein WJX73_007694 [Symbiochloris irregularis]|uniref:Peptidase M20 dimerisation domain-containing protein n=1 Tax=Symbiochloris irregularis TaxID=706552 RepID=A0AAW1NWH7_9CHLO